MRKKNVKGFMMAELVVVGAVVLTTLVGLYTSFNKIFSAYDVRLSYYDVATLYRLGYYRDILIENNLINDIIDNFFKNDNRIVNIYDSENFNGQFNIPEEENMKNKEDKVFMIYNKKEKVNSIIFGDIEVNKTFKDYVDYLEESVDFSDFDYMFIMERCSLSKSETSNDEQIVDNNKCSYAYLEFWNDENDE